MCNNGQSMLHSNELFENKQRKLIQKPWMTKGIFKSIKNKLKFYKSNFLEGTFELNLKTFEQNLKISK